MKSIHLALSCGMLLLAATSNAVAWESDVHYGLTHWLAVKAGFEDREARVIATGNQRVDSGDMQYIEPMFAYGCVGADETGTKRAGEHHYPTAGAVPGPAEGRAVVAGSDAANKAAGGALKVPAAQATFMLHRLGEALHPLQDSWSHQGVPDVPAATESHFACDKTRMWAHPTNRGGWSSHKADLTSFWPADVVAMAKATYDVLTKFPANPGTTRTATPWEKVRPALDGFIKATTKTDKAKWFVAQGLQDLSFLGGISLRDGAQPFDDEWPGRRFPTVPTDQSRQHHVDEELLDFYHRFFEQWVAGKDFNALATEFGRPTAANKPELVARLKLWRLRDHGRVADIAHTLRALTPQQRATIDAVAKEKEALAIYEGPTDAYFPILPRTGNNEVSPLLPFVIRTIAGEGKNPRAAAVVKFRHTPYDVLAVVAEKTGKDWRVVTIVPAVDH